MAKQILRWDSWICKWRLDSLGVESTRVKKTSRGESLARSHAYNPIWDSRGDFSTRNVSPTVSSKVSPSVSARISARLLARLSARLLARLFAPRSPAKRLAESLGSDYIHDSRRYSFRDSFFYAGNNFFTQIKHSEYVSTKFSVAWKIWFNHFRFRIIRKTVWIFQETNETVKSKNNEWDELITDINRRNLLLTKLNRTSI